MTITITVKPNNAAAIVRTSHENTYTTEDGKARSSGWQNNEEIVPDGVEKTFSVGTGGFSVSEVSKDVKTFADLETVECIEKSTVSGAVNAEIADAGLAVEVAGGEMVDTTN